VLLVSFAILARELRSEKEGIKAVTITEKLL
jgi:hypothetical protein